MNSERDRKSQDKGKAYPDNTDGKRPQKERQAPGRADDERQHEKTGEGRQTAR